MWGIVSSGVYFDLVCFVFFELFVNVIEYGLLKLDLVLKDDLEGFFVFYELWEKWMSELDESYWVNLDVDYDFVCL